MSGLEDSAWIARINRHFGRRCKVVWSGHKEPRVRRIGVWKVSGELLPEVERSRDELRERGKPNEKHALCVNQINFTDEKLDIGYQTIDFATARVLRSRKLCPGYGILSASSFLVSVERRIVFVQRRSASMDLNPGRLHGFAGAYSPGHELDDSDGDKFSLIKTAHRALREETCLDLVHMQPVNLVVFSDPLTTAIEICLLGVAVTDEEIARLEDTDEGTVYPIPMDELGDFLLQDERWGPGGQCEVMAWLALGAHPFRPDERFSGLTAQQTFERLTTSIR